jgi:hypothetical protein
MRALSLRQLEIVGWGRLSFHAVSRIGAALIPDAGTDIFTLNHDLQL